MRSVKSRIIVGSALAVSTIAGWMWRRRTSARRRLELLSIRVRGEYREMPGLRLTLQQACRLWQLDSCVCEQLLATLTDARYLYRTSDGRYIAFGE
jgi:hypothetical protein